MSRYLITGGAGFIGSHIAEELVRREHSIKIIDNYSTGNKKNLYPLYGDIILWEASIADDYEMCLRVVEDVDFVIHLAALSSVPRSIKNPLLTNNINIGGTLNMLLASREAKVKRFIFASSSSVYGNNINAPKRENDRENPLSPYAISKLTGEHYCKVFSRFYGLSTVCLRYFNIFGPRQDSISQYAPIIPRFISKMLKGEAPMVFGDGEQTRDFTYVSNAVDATILASEARRVSGRVFNVACGVKTSVNSLVLMINGILGTNIVPYYTEARRADVKHSFADISRARKALKYEPSVSLEEGLERTVQWHRERSG